MDNRFRSVLQDDFKEDIVCSRSTTLSNIMYILCWIFIVLLAVYAFLGLQILMISFSLPNLLTLLLSAGAAVALFFFKDYLKVEYEYTFTNGNLDFAKVMRSARRKELGSMNVKKLTACGHVAHESFQTYISMKDLVRRNWFLNRDGNLFYLYYIRDNRKHIIIIEPSEEMVALIRKTVDPGVYKG